MKLEGQVLRNVLKSIGTNDEHKVAPSREYLNALETLGMAKLGWDNTLTDLGQGILNHLNNKLDKW